MQGDLGKFLDHLFIFIETPADPALAQTSHEDNATEESPLLASGSRHKPVLCNKKIPLVLRSHPEVSAIINIGYRSYAARFKGRILLGEVHY